MPPEVAEELENEAADRGDNVPVEESGVPSKEEVAAALPASKTDAPAPEEEDAEEDVKQSAMIPKSRYDFKAAQAKEAQKRATELEAKLRQYEDRDAKKDEGPTVDAKLAEIAQQIADAKKDGNTDKVIELMDQKHELQIAALAQSQRPGKTVDPEAISEAAIDKIRMEDLIDQLEERYSMLVPDSEDYDEDVVTEITDLRTAFEQRGYSRFDSLQRAVHYVIGTREAAPAPAPEPAKGGKRKTDVVKNLDAARKLPPDPTKISTPSDGAGLQDELPSASKLTDKDMDALPESTLRRMRGDYF
jgi:hypothetical protein